MRPYILLAVIATATISCNNKTNSPATVDNITGEPKTESTTDNDDNADVAASVQDLFNQVDARQWSELPSKLTDSVHVNYAALGGKQEVQSSSDLISDWEALLPGFDRTIHNVHNVATHVASDRASATFDAIATHVLNGDAWSVYVGYDTEFIKEDDNWKLARIDVSLYDQSGNTDLPKAAMNRVASNQVKPISTTASANRAVVQGFFNALEERNLDNVVNSFTANGAQIMPYAPDMFPSELNGQDAIRKQYTGVMEYDQSYDVEFLPTGDDNTVLANYNGKITTNEGKPYNNSYVGVFKIKNGKIHQFHEMFSPKVLLQGWPGLEPSTYSVHDSGARRDSGIGMEEVTFASNGTTLRGHLFTPKDFDENKTYPAAIVTGSWTSVKEQMPDTYASRLAQEGMVTLTFDFRGFGASDGTPRQVEDINLKTEDIRAAVDFLAAHPNVDKENLVGLGFCASSGYMAHATAQDERIKKLVLVAPWLHNPEIARGLYDARPGGTDGLLARGDEAAKNYEETGEMEYVLAASELDPLTAMYVPNNVFDYYLNPAKAAGSVYDNRFAVSSWRPWLTMDGISVGANIDKPVHIIHSESGAVPQGAKAFYDLLPGKKSIEWLNQYTQEDLYYKQNAVDHAIAGVVDYLEL